MKKLFTLLAALMLVSSAFAIKPNMKHAQLDPNCEINKNFNARNYFEMAKANADENNRPMRFSFEMDGKIWLGEMALGSFTWADRLVFQDPDNPSGPGIKFDFEEFPFYDVIVYVYCQDVNDFQQYTYDLFYPSKVISGMAKEDAPDALEVTPLSYWNEDSMPFEVMEPGLGGSSEEAFGAWFQANSYIGLSGAANYMVPGSSLAISNFDEDEMSISLNIRGSLCETSAPYNPVAGSNFYVPFTGEFEQNGFIAKNYNLDWSEFHIYNAGTVDSKSWYWYDDTSWKPLNRFVIYALGEGFIIDESVKDNIPNPNEPGGMYLKDQSYVDLFNTDRNNPAFSFMYGAIYTEPGENDNQPVPGWYTSNVISYEKQGNFLVSVGTPVAGKYILSDYLDSQNASMFKGIFVEDNLQITYCGSSVELVEDALGLYILNEKGTGAYGKDAYNNNVNLMYKGDIIYHYDPTDYTKTQKLKAIGTDKVEGLVADAQALIEAANGVVVVKAVEDVDVVLYNVAGVAVKSVKVLAGETATIEAGNGLFIVKAGNTVKKVAL